ncbi:hypothetical protein, partial [Rhodoblastus sphagnicola]|uniref:hypothetical protein n=1 Tax=Rhodoblastus sphagnicola TaxID=333368 RepID=UPI001AEE88D7
PAFRHCAYDYPYAQCLTDLPAKSQAVRAGRVPSNELSCENSGAATERLTALVRVLARSAAGSWYSESHTADGAALSEELS